MKKHNWHPPDYDKQDIRAIQSIAAWAAAEPDEHGVVLAEPPTSQDCKHALDWLINKACGTYDEPFRPNDTDAVFYMLGRRSVGLAIVKLMKLKPEIFKEAL